MAFVELGSSEWFFGKPEEFELLAFTTGLLIASNAAAGAKGQDSEGMTLESLATKLAPETDGMSNVWSPIHGASIL